MLFDMDVQNPYHPHALRLCDLTPRRRIVRFKAAYPPKECIVIAGPHYGFPGDIMESADSFPTALEMIVVPLLTVATGKVHMESVAEIGIIPFTWGKFDPECYTIDKEHYTPTGS